MDSTVGKVETIDLQTWAKENKIWKKESWMPFLRDLEKLYLMLTEFWEFHEWLKMTFNNKRISLLPEELKNPARLIIAGGGKNENAFARMMFKLFNVKVAGASSYEESVTIYEGRGDGTRILVGSKVLGIEKGDIRKALQDLEKVVRHFKQQLRVSTDSEMHEEDFTEWVNPENPKIVDRLNEFLNLAANMLEPTNPYVLFIRYLNVASLGIIVDFLGCNIEGVKSLAELLDAQVYDSELNPGSVKEVNVENVNDLFWLLSQYDSPTRPVSSRILSLLGEGGVVHRIVRGMYPEIDTKFEELWKQRFNSLVELMKSGRWILPLELRIFLRQEAIKEVCRENSYAILIVKPANSDSVEIDAWDLSLNYSCTPRTTVKTEYSVIIPLEDLFPLFATNYLQARVSDNSRHRAAFRACKFLAVRPRCQGKYKNGKDSYLRLIKALGELKNESKADD